MKKQHILIFLLLILITPIHAKAAEFVVDCSKTSADPKEKITCDIKGRDSNEVSALEAYVSVTNGTITSVTKVDCEFGSLNQTEVSCITQIKPNEITFARYEIEVGETGKTEIKFTEPKIVTGTDFKTVLFDDFTVDITIQSYKLTLNNQSATTAGTTSVTAYYNRALQSIETPKRQYTVTYNYNGNGTANTTAKSTYAFGGYYTATNGGGTKYYNADGTGTKNFDLHENKTLYAQWTGGSVTLPTTSRTGYTFNGWYDAATGGTKIGAAGATYTPTANKTLYAQWDGNKYNLTLNNQSATTAGTSTIYLKYGTGYYLDNNLTNKMSANENPITNPQRQYTVTYNYNGNGTSNTTAKATYTFGGYYTATNGGGTQVLDNNGRLTSSASNTAYTANTTLYAKWTSSKVTLPNPTKENSVFLGWYDAATGGTKIGDGGATYTPTANKTLYAHWQEELTSNTYEIKDKKVFVNPTSKIYTGTELQSHVEYAGTFEIYNKNNVKVELSAKVGTGFKIKTNSSYYDIIVFGDVTGDGEIAIGDVSAEYNHYKDKTTLTGLYFEAGKVTNNSNISIGDVSKLYNMYKGKF